MKNRIIIISEHDLVKYPPMQSLLQILFELKREVCYIGYCSDKDTQHGFEKKNVVFYDLPCSFGKNILNRWINNIKYRRKFKAILKSLDLQKEDLVIYVHTDTAYYIHDLLEQYRYVVLFYEFINPCRSWKYKILYSSYSLSKLLKKSVGVIHCEYNRAQITKGLYNLDKLPYILPNKPYIDESIMIKTPPEEISEILTRIKKITEGKNIILYQGIFNSKERRLEEFCQAMNLLPDNYVLLAMGEGNEYYECLKSKYESDRVLFIPFIRPPYHLLITQLAAIGILSYFPVDNTYAGVINPLYCAPNKIFEYSKYSIPMISNDIPGTKGIFDKFGCGRVVCDPFTPEQIKDTILEIINNYSDYSKGTLEFYNSVDIKNIISDMLEDIDGMK